MTRLPAKLMLMDACVLIDYWKAERSTLELFVKHVGQVHIVSAVVEEVRDCDSVDELIELGLVIVEPELEDAFAAVGRKGSTSFQDNLCLLTAKRFGFTCVTNDKNLRRCCAAEDVPVLWGLQLLVELHQSGGIPAADAIDIARRIHETNPKHITPRIVQRFTEIILSP